MTTDTAARGAAAQFPTPRATSGPSAAGSPRALMAALDELTREFETAKDDPAFTAELDDLLANYAAARAC